jgi:hypothetical protein
VAATGGGVTYLETDVEWDDIPPPTPPDEPNRRNGHRFRAEAPPDDDQLDDDPGKSRERSIEIELDKLRIRAEARRRLDYETRPQINPPPVKPLDALLAEPDSPLRYRVDKVMPLGGRVIVSAQFKAGKTTVVGNWLRSLSDSDLFLGRFTVNTPARHIVLIDDELSENTLRHWLRDQNIANTAAVADVIALRGKVGAFNLLDDRRRAQWADRLRDVGCDHLVLDCLRPVLDALGLDENRDAGKFLVAFDALLDEAGIADSLTVQHMGHANERARGDSRLQDWPDAIWRLVRETDDPDSPRYFSAYGRDVNVAEGRLGFDPPTRRLTYAAGSRTDSKAEAAYVAVIELLAAENGDAMSKSAVENELADDHTQKAIRSAINTTVSRGVVVVEDGPRGAKLHRIAHPCSECGFPVTGKGPRHQTCKPDSRELALE